jgi:hypothetical protein
MGSILGGGSKGGGSAITGAAQGVANAAIEGGQRNYDTYNNLATNVSGAINAGANTAATGATGGAQTSASAQQHALDYLMTNDTLPRNLRESALNSLGGLYGGTGSITERAMASPLYKSAVQQGENAVLRNASATGGLRSGTANENLAQVNQNALVAAYNDQVQGLQGLSSLSSNANNIAGYMSSIGNTLGQGQINSANILGQGQVSAAQNFANYTAQGAQELTSGNLAAANALSQGQIAKAQNSAQGSQNGMNNMMGMAGMGMQAFSQFSDRRLKSNIEFAGEENGVRKYKWTWNKIARRLGLSGKGSGVMADEVLKTHPEAVSMRDGYMHVDYSKLGVSHGV